MSESRYENVVVRVKRKLEDLADAPSRLILPKKLKVSDDGDYSLEAVFKTLDVSNTEPKPCVDTPKGRKALVFSLSKRKREEVSEDGGVEKKTRYIDLELDEKGISKSSNGKEAARSNSDEMDFAIWHSFRTGDFVFCESLLQQGVNVNYQRNVDGTTVLMAACAHADVELLNKLMSLGACTSTVDKQGFTADDHIGASMETILPLEQRAKISKMLQETGYAYDTYVVEQEVDTLEQSAVWTDSGIKTEWQDNSVIAQFEIDFEAYLDDADDLDLNQEPDSDDNSENREDCDHENYMYNDYPEDEEESVDSAFECTQAEEEEVSSEEEDQRFS